ncbi:MAG: TetR/AcrR family transcriptional regulator [Halioglobus sp.]|nr:TetR/AcrR family transcriptional regulator [Halioglobus sp.]
MATTRVSNKTTYHHGDLKAVLLDETARILRDEGESALSLRRLAANVGVSRTAPYHHFKDKQSLLSAVAEEGFIRFNHTMQAVLEQGRGKGGERVMREYVNAYVDFAVNNSEYYDLMYGSQLWRSDSLASSLLSSARSTLRAEVERLQALQARGLISQTLDPLRFTQVAWGMLHGISRLLVDGIYTDAASASSICETAAGMLWQQLRE